MQLSLDQVKEMAPDEKSVAAAQKLDSPKHWDAPGLSETALWGLCGPGKYKVSVDLTDMGYRCNCPSRKFPCKHVLAMLMLLSKTPDALQIADPPGWVSDWIEKRKQRQQLAAEKASQPSKPVDKKAQSKRVEEREQKIQTGIEQLSLWMDDLVRGGIAGLESKSFTFWDEQARRLVDSQAKGLASRVRLMSEIPRSGPDWPTRLMEELGRTRLLMHAYQRQEELSEPLRTDVRQFVGWTVSQAELADHGDVVEDEWYVLGQRIEEEDRFRSQRSWLLGKETKQSALMLQFAPGVQGFPESIIPGYAIPGKLTFYPGSLRQRAKFIERQVGEPNTLTEIVGAKSVDEYLQSFAEQLGKNPWLGSDVCVLEQVTLTLHHGRWFVRDSNGAALPLRVREPYRLLSVTGGHPFLVMGEWNGAVLSPLGLIYDGIFGVCQ